MVASDILVIVKAQQTRSRAVLLSGDVVGAMAQTHHETRGGEVFTACKPA